MLINETSSNGQRNTRAFVVVVLQYSLYMCLGFSPFPVDLCVCVCQQVLCQPRPKDWDPSKEAEEEVDGQAAKARPRMAAEGLALILAAGFFALAPSNHLLRKRHREALEAQAEEEARKRRQEEEEEEMRRLEAAGSEGPWASRCDEISQDGTDMSNEAGVHDVVAIISAEDSGEDELPPDPHLNLPGHQEEPEADVQSGVDTAAGQSLSGGREGATIDPHHFRCGESRLRRLPSIAESKEEDVSEVPTETNTLVDEEATIEDPAAQDVLDMTAVENSLRQLDGAEVDLNSGFPLPVEDLPLPSEDLLRPDDSYPSADEDLPLPDVPDDDLPLPVEELPLPDWSNLSEPQAEALQMSSVDRVPYDHYSSVDNPGHDSADNRPVGFDENSAVGYEEYLDLNPDTQCHLSNGVDDDLTDHIGGGYLDDHLGAGGFNEGYEDGYGENHIPQDDYSHWNGDLDHGDHSGADFYANHSDFHFHPGEHPDDADGDFDYSSRDLNGDDHFDVYGADEVNDLYVSDSNYISYEDTSNYDGFCVEDLSSSGGGGGGGDWGGFFGNCDGGDGGGGGDSGGMGNTASFLLLGGGDLGGDGGGGAACGGGGAACGGGGGGCGGCGG